MFRKFTGILFDLDGTLVDSEEIHFKTTDKLLSDYGFRYTLELKRKFMGIPVPVWMPELVKMFKIQDSPQLLLKKRAKIFRELIERELQLMPGALEMLEFIKRSKLLCGLGTSAEDWYMEHVLTKFDIRKYFHHIVGTKEVKHGKPHPEVYLKLADKLKLDPTKCLVIEDSTNGIKAAKAAGMRCFALKGQYTDRNIIREADKIFDSLVDIKMHLEGAE